MDKKHYDALPCAGLSGSLTGSKLTILETRKTLKSPPLIFRAQDREIVDGIWDIIVSTIPENIDWDNHRGWFRLH